MSDDHIAPLLARIDEAFDHDLAPVPESVLSAARAAFGWRDIDARLAELQFDSASDELVGVRGTVTERRSFRFGIDDAVIRVHLTDATMVVMVEPPVSTVCRVTSGAGEGVTIEHRTDDLGELVIDAPDLPVRVDVDLPSGRTVTPWMTG